MTVSLCERFHGSPSVWREWIEMINLLTTITDALPSPSVWREWIEML